MSPHLLRRRRDDDLPALADVLAGQQPHSGYPYVWPRERPVDFVRRDGELAAWTAELDGAPVGHISLLAVAPEDPAAPGWSEGTGLRPDELACVSALFVARTHWSRGIGVDLLRTACEWAQTLGLLPCLDVVPEHARALDLYRRLGWREVGRMRPDWLRDGAGPVLLLVAAPGPGSTAGTVG